MKAWLSGSAVLSTDGRYRYELWRTFDMPLLDSRGTVAFCMLNPSTADATTDDATIRRCIGYARSWGYHKLAVVNLCAYRTTDPAELSRVVEWRSIVGPDNWRHLHRVLRQADLRVAAWGGHKVASGNAAALLSLYIWHALGLTVNGAPVHPLYQPKAAVPRLMVRRARWELAA